MQIQAAGLSSCLTDMKTILHLQGLKDIVLNDPDTEDAEAMLMDAAKNDEAYAELIRSSKNLEQVIEQWSEAENVRHKITGTGTALALSSISKSIIEQDMAERKLAETVAVVVTPKESVGV